MSPTRDLPEAGWLERRASPAFRYRKRSRTVMDTAEESYLRLDIPCGCPSCPACPRTSPALPPAPPHLLLPDAGVLEECLEVFELPELEGTVLLSSELRQLAEGGNMRRTTRLQALYTDRRRRNVAFDNLHHRETAPVGGTSGRRGGLAVLAAAEWYYEHLGRRLPVVVLSDALAAQFGAGEQPAAAEAAAESAAGGAAGSSRTQGQGPGQQWQRREEEGGDDELDALLAQMHIGGGSGSTASSSMAAAGSRGGGAAGGAGADIGGLFDSLGLGEPGAGAADSGRQRQGLQPPPGFQQQQQHSQQPHSQQQQPQEQQAPLVLEPGVHILSSAAYFGGCWGGVPAVMDVFDSIQQSKAAVKLGDQAATAGGFRPHLSAAALEAGLSIGELLSGTLCVSRRVRGEGTVAVGGGLQVLVSGRGGMNRAVHGDRVAIRLLPREQWRPASQLAGGARGGLGGGEGQEEVEGEEEEEAEHDLLATAGDGEADVAADEAAAGAGVEGEEALGSLGRLLQGAAADALQPTGEVVGVLQRWSGEVVACISEEDERALAAKGDSSRQEAVLCIPTDRRLPRIRLRSRQLHRLLGQRLVLRLDGWELGNSFPHGHLVRALGPINSLRSETDGVLVSSGVHWQPFSMGALRELPPVASSREYAMPPAELAGRRDLRGPDYLVCSIDPPGCTDVDDALSVRWLDSPDDSSGGNSGSSRAFAGGGRRLVEVGVHIADVSFFVRQGGMLDSEAASRCTTVYLVDRRLDMLPALLSEDLCSLRGGQDRYAVSVLWTLDADSFEVLDVWFGRTLIRSRYQLEYSQAQGIMEGQPPQPGLEGAIAPSDRPLLQRNLALLAALADHRRELRLQAGAVELESAELRFRTDPSGQPTKVAVKQEIPMMIIVAEMMILANAAVAERVAAAFPRAALLRRHPPPRREAFEEVAALCESLGSPLDLSGSPAALAASLAAAAAAAPPALASLIKSLATRAMSEAEYFCTGDASGRGGPGGGFGHFGLALPFYTHFTSPIRRYADVVVHRQLLAAVAAGSTAGTAGTAGAALGLPAGAQAAPPPLPGPDVSAKAAVMNDRHRTAKRAQKECSDLFLLLLLHSQPHVEAATVYALRPTALLVFIPKYHLRGVIHLTDKHGLCRPPLRQPGEEQQQQDPFSLAYRRGLSVVARQAAGAPGQAAGGGSAGLGAGPGEAQQPSGPAELAVLDAASGRHLAAFRPMQRVWVQLSAEGSRAHGPRLRMRLLDDSHPAALEAAQREAAAAAAGRAGNVTAGAAAGCGSLPRGPGGPGLPARPAYRPPLSVGPAGAGRPAVLPGFEGRQAAPASGPAAQAESAAAAVQHGAEPQRTGSSSGAGGASQAPAAGPCSLAAELQAAVQQAGGQAAERQALCWQAELPAMGHQQEHEETTVSSAAASRGSGQGQGDLESGLPVRRALRRLQARAARLQLKAASKAASRPSARRRQEEAEAARLAAAALRGQLVPAG